MKRKADVIADYESEIEALYEGLDKKNAEIKALQIRISMLREELYLKNKMEADRDVLFG